MDRVSKIFFKYSRTQWQKVLHNNKQGAHVDTSHSGEQKAQLFPPGRTVSAGLCSEHPSTLAADTPSLPPLRLLGEGAQVCVSGFHNIFDTGSLPDPWHL